MDLDHDQLLCPGAGDEEKSGDEIARRGSRSSGSSMSRSLGSRDTDTDKDTALASEGEVVVVVNEAILVTDIVECLLCVRPLPDGISTAYDVLQKTRPWFLKNYVSFSVPDQDALFLRFVNQKNGQKSYVASFPALLWLATADAHEHEHEHERDHEFVSGRRAKAPRFGLKLSTASCKELLEKHTRTLSMQRYWDTQDRYRAWYCISRLTDPSTYGDLLEAATRVDYWRAYWDHIRNTVPEIGDACDYPGIPGDVEAAALETRLAKYMRDYEKLEDSDSSFLDDGRLVVTKVLCEAGSTPLYRAQHPGTIQQLSQVKPVQALLACEPREGTDAQLAAAPGTQNPWPRVLAGWHLYVLSRFIDNAETRHRTMYTTASSGSGRRKRRGGYLRGDTAHNVSGSFMREHVVTNFDWGRTWTALDKLLARRYNKRRPSVWQFKDEWFVCNYVSGNLLSFGKDTDGRSACIRALSCWLTLMKRDFHGKMANGTPVPCILNNPL